MTDTQNPNHVPDAAFARTIKVGELEPGVRLADHAAAVAEIRPADPPARQDVFLRIVLADGTSLELNRNDRVAVAIEHGTTAAAARHRRYKVPMCEPCADAERARTAERVRQHRASGGNLRIGPNEIFAMRSEPTEGVTVLDIHGHGRYFIFRDGTRSARLLPVGPSGVAHLDGEMWPVGTVHPVEPGRKISFNSTGDVWRLVIVAGRPAFEKC